MLGRLEKVELRDIWKHEALDFTNWLAKKENIDLLSETLELDIEVEKVEASVGSFNVDILAKDSNSDESIVIENQLEKTDHDHLGKIITYASGYDARIIIWIVKEVREEHKKAVEWLNNHLDDEINIFLIEIEVWKIGNSEPAPKFNIIESPNNWAKIVKASSVGQKSSPTKDLQYDFWVKLSEVENRLDFKLRTPGRKAWTDIALGKSNYTMRLEAYKKRLVIGVIVKDESIYENLVKIKKDIENNIGNPLVWEEKDNGTKKIFIDNKNFNLEDTKEWATYIEWLVETTNLFMKNFKK